MKYLDPKNDLIFKKVFGEHPDILRSFLNSMLPLAEGQEIVELEYLSPEMIPETFLEKFTAVDVRCKDNHGRQFLIEMQMNWTTAFKQRRSTLSCWNNLKSTKQYSMSWKHH